MNILYIDNVVSNQFTGFQELGIRHVLFIMKLQLEDMQYILSKSQLPRIPKNPRIRKTCGITGAGGGGLIPVGWKYQ